MTIPNGIRTESDWIPFASIEIDTRYVTTRDQRPLHPAYVTVAPSPVRPCRNEMFGGGSCQ